MTLNGVMALFCLILGNSGSFLSHFVKKFTFAISSPDEFLSIQVADLVSALSQTGSSYIDMSR